MDMIPLLPSQFERAALHPLSLAGLLLGRFRAADYMAIDELRQDQAIELQLT